MYSKIVYFIGFLKTNAIGKIHIFRLRRGTFILNSDSLDYDIKFVFAHLKNKSMKCVKPGDIYLH